MSGVKDLILRPIPGAEANAFIRRVHYSGTVVRNSQLHIGVYWQGALEGVLQFGPPIDRRRMLGLVAGTPWSGMVELNRLACTEALPRNSESRALAVACRLLRRHAPAVKWIVTFADGAQCGDGTIYRAAGFLLTAIKRNDQIWEFAGTNGAAPVRLSRMTVTSSPHLARRVLGDAAPSTTPTGGASMAPFKAAGARPVPGFQLRYVKFLDATWRPRLTVPVLPYAAIAAAGARMSRGRSAEIGTAAPTAGDGEIPIRPLHP